MKNFGRLQNRLWRVGLGLGAALLLSVGCSAAGSDGKTLRVGMECDYTPFNWTQTTDANGAVKLDSSSYAAGYDVEISKKIAAGLGMNIEIVKTEWDGLLPALTSGKIDVIIAGMSPTEERKQVIDFTNEYYTSDLVVVVLKDGPFGQAKTLADFSGAKITGQLNTFHYTVIEQIPGADQQTAMSDFPTMLAALTSKKIDGYVSERPGAISAAMSNTGVTYIAFEPGQGFISSPEDVTIAVGVKKGSDLTEKMNQILVGISEADRQKLMEEAIANQPLSQE